MNTNFIEHFEKKAISIYQLSRNTGIPYTTLSEIASGKLDINKCAAETVQKLAVEFDVAVVDLLNPVKYYEGIQGKYRGFKYRWKSCDQGNMKIEIKNSDDEVVLLDGGARFILPSVKQYERLAAEMAIDVYLQKNELEGLEV